MSKDVFEPDPRMKIVLIVQLYNEFSSGFIQQFCKYNISLFDDVIAYDDGSTDETAKYCLSKGIRVIRGKENNLKAERDHKAQLIEYADVLDANFIVSLDADEILVCTRAELEGLCESLISNGLSGFESNFINLWRSYRYKRTDSLFNDYKPVKLWRHVPATKPFSDLKRGLHQRLYPDYVTKISYNNKLVILHTGFTTVDRILEKFVTYRSLGQKGFDLMRFIDESSLSVDRVPDKYLPKDWALDDVVPTQLSIRDFFQNIEKVRKRVLAPKVTVFSLIYKDIGWLDFVYKQVLKTINPSFVEFYFVANDADEIIIEYMRENYIPYHEYKNSKKHRTENYINNVYRAYNFGVSKASGEAVVMINSDMAFTPGWLENLLIRGGEDVAVASRLIEQGKLRTGKHGIVKNFGASWESFDENAFNEYSALISQPKTEDGGLYMPLLVRRQDFEKVGGFPEGNIVSGSDIFAPEIAGPSEPLVSGDAVLIQKLEAIGIRHVTAFDSIVYHFQEGEKRSSPKQFISQIYGSTFVCNDSLKGIHGEKVLWGHLLDLPNMIGMDHCVVGGKAAQAFLGYAANQKIFADVVIQNATFVPRFFQSIHTIMYLQDNLRAMGLPSRQQEENLRYGECLLTNTIETAASYPEFDFDICPVGVDHRFFCPLDKKKMRKKHNVGLDQKVGIFVGALDTVKGWPEVYEIIRAEEEIHWLVVTKYEGNVEHPRIKHYSKQNQKVLVELLNCADFFVLGSKVETQCLAAIEAALCNIPVVIRPVGIFSSFTGEEVNSLGYVGYDLHGGVLRVLNQNVTNPRKLMLTKGVTLEAVACGWRQILCREKMLVLSQRWQGRLEHPREADFLRKILNFFDFYYRVNILRPLINRDTFYTVSEISSYVRRTCPPYLHKFLRLGWRIMRGKI